MNGLKLKAVFRACVLPVEVPRESCHYPDRQFPMSTTKVGYAPCDFTALFTSFFCGHMLEGCHLGLCISPGKGNVAADHLSRGGPLPGEWWLCSGIVQAIWSQFSQAQMDLFASQETTYYPWSYSMVEPRDTWHRALMYAFPPFPLLPVELTRVEVLRMRVLLVAPDWPHLSWMVQLVAILTGFHWHLLARPDILFQVQGLLWRPNPEVYKLHVWPLDRSHPLILTHQLL